MAVISLRGVVYVSIITMGLANHHTISKYTRKAAIKRRMSNEYLIDRFDDIIDQSRSLAILLESLSTFPLTNKEINYIVTVQRKLANFVKDDIYGLRNCLLKKSRMKTKT